MRRADSDQLAVAISRAAGESDLMRAGRVVLPVSQMRQQMHLRLFARSGSWGVRNRMVFRCRRGAIRAPLSLAKALLGWPAIWRCRNLRRDGKNGPGAVAP